MIAAGDRARLEQIARRCQALRGELDAELDRRDALIRQVVDERGATFRAAGRAAGISPAQVAKVLAAPART